MWHIRKYHTYCKHLPMPLPMWRRSAQTKIVQVVLCANVVINTKFVEKHKPLKSVNTFGVKNLKIDHWHGQIQKYKSTWTKIPNLENVRFKCEDTFRITKRNQQLKTYSLQIWQFINPPTSTQTQRLKKICNVYFQTRFNLI